MKISDIQVTPIHPERWGDDLDVVNSARVSFHKESEMVYDYLLERDNLEPKDAKLIYYLAKHKHFSPFNHSFLSFRIKAPIFVARQLVKHKFMPWNEVSRRYVDEEPEFYFPDYWRKKADNAKQGSANEEATSYVFHEYGKGVPDRFETGVDTTAEDAFAYMTEHASDLYSAMVFAGIAPEQARMVLPQSMMTEWIWSGTLGAFLDMLVLRLDPHTQKESRDVAQLIANEVKKYFPVSFNARIN